MQLQRQGRLVPLGEGRGRVRIARVPRDLWPPRGSVAIPCEHVYDAKHVQNIFLPVLPNKVHDSQRKIAKAERGDHRPEGHVLPEQ